MPEIEFSCISCRSALTASKSDVGELVQCPSCNHTMKVPRYGVVAGMQLGDFKVLKCLGVGGMGEVWLAEQGSLQRRVALKILSPDISNDPSFIHRFNQEVRIAGKLIHPNIVVAFHAGEQNGIRYLTCAYIDGLVASEELEVNGPIDEANVLRIGRDIAKGLKYAWEKAHILHRDVKPDNIMLGKDGTPMLMDMGISKNFDEDVSLTMTGEIIGTPYYISPEQAHAADDIDFRADQYSLGATLFHLITGSLPYQATSAMGILAQHLQNPVPDARDIKPEVSQACSKMIQKMMAKKPEDRYLSWDEFIVAANSLLPPEMRDGTMLPGTITVPKKNSLKPMVIGALAGVIIIAILLSAFLTARWLKRKRSRNPLIVQKNQDVTKRVPARIKPDNTEVKTSPPEEDKPPVTYKKPATDKPPETDKANSGKNPKPDLFRNIRIRKLNENKGLLKTFLQRKHQLPESEAADISDKWANMVAKKHGIDDSSGVSEEELRKEFNQALLKSFGEKKKKEIESNIKNFMGRMKRPYGVGDRKRRLR